MLVEFRFPLPFTLEEYQVAQLYTVAIEALDKNDGDSQVEILANEPYDDSERGRGQYTEKVVHFGSKIPRIVEAILPASAKMMIEKAWNAYPLCHTEYSIPFFGERFYIGLDSTHIEDDNGSIDNVFNLTEEQLEERIVMIVDIGKDQAVKNEIDKVLYDPSSFISERTGRGPLTPGWVDTMKPIMCAYKLASIKFQMFGFQTKGENMILNYQKNLLNNFHKKVFCLIDGWYGMNMQDIRRIEDETKARIEAAKGEKSDSTTPFSEERSQSISSTKSAPPSL